MTPLLSTPRCMFGLLIAIAAVVTSAIDPIPDGSSDLVVVTLSFGDSIESFQQQTGGMIVGTLAAGKYLMMCSPTCRTIATTHASTLERFKETTYAQRSAPDSVQIQRVDSSINALPLAASGPSVRSEGQQKTRFFEVETMQAPPSASTIPVRVVATLFSGSPGDTLPLTFQSTTPMHEVLAIRQSWESGMAAHLAGIDGVVTTWSNNWNRVTAVCSTPAAAEAVAAQMNLNPRVRSVHIDPPFEPKNAAEIRLVCDDDTTLPPPTQPTAAVAWMKQMLHGEGTLIGLVDTGVDYENCVFGQDQPAPFNHGLTIAAKVFAYYAQSGSWCGNAPGVMCGDDVDADNGHGTHVAGTLAGWDDSRSGVPTDSANECGVTPRARLSIFDIHRHGSDSHLASTIVTPPLMVGKNMMSVLQSDGASVVVNGWGCAGVKELCNRYSPMEQEIDEWVYQTQTTLPVFPAGNEGATSGASSIASPATAKNVLTVGSCASNGSVPSPFTSQGPTFMAEGRPDGRIKPEIVAPGDSVTSTFGDSVRWTQGYGIHNCPNPNHAVKSGTSMAAAVAGGFANAVNAFYRKGLHRSDGEKLKPSAALLRATLVNAARPLSGSTLPSPNMVEGFGLPDLSRGLDMGLADSPKMFVTDKHHLDGVNTGEVVYHFFNDIPVNSEFAATLAWSDFAADPTADASLVNDLNLKCSIYSSQDIVNRPMGTVFYPNGFTSGADDINNIEKILIPATGNSGSTLTFDLLCSVTGAVVVLPAGTRQGYALVATGKWVTAT